MIFAINAKPFGDKRRNIGREEVRRAFKRKSPSLSLIFLKEVFPMGYRELRKME
jgi:hypothetical protein